MLLIFNISKEELIEKLSGWSSDINCGNWTEAKRDIDRFIDKLEVEAE